MRHRVGRYQASWYSPGNRSPDQPRYTECWCQASSFPNDKFYTIPNWKSLHTTSLNLMKMTGSSPKGLKTLWEKEKLLVSSNCSFSHSVFKRLVLQTRKNQGSVGKGLRYQPIYRRVHRWFWDSCSLMWVAKWFGCWLYYPKAVSFASIALKCPWARLFTQSAKHNR